MSGRLVVLSVVSAAFGALPMTAAAAPKPIPPQVLFESPSITGLRLAVSSADEALTVISPSRPPDDAPLVSRVRGGDGQIGRLQELSRNPDAYAPADVRFSPAGDLFLTWPVAGSGARGEFAVRPRGGLFSAPATWKVGQCSSLGSVAYEPSGRPQVACGAAIGSGATNQGVVVLPASSSSGFAFSSAVAVQAGDSASPYSSIFDIGTDGTRAVVWTRSVSAGFGSAKTTSVMMSVAPPGQGFGTPQTVASETFIAFDESLGYGSVTVLPDGRVAVLYCRFNGFTFATTTCSVAIRSVAGVVTKEKVPSSSEGSALMEPDGAGLLVAWAEKNLGTREVTIKVAKVTTPASGPVFGQAQKLDANASGVQSISLAVAPNGAAALARSKPAGSNREFGVWYRSASDKPFQAPVALATAGTIGSPVIAMDRFGSVAASWVESGSPNQKVMFGGLDAAGPTLAGFSIPARLRQGRGAAFAVRATDPSGVARVKWSFGDRGTANGASARHSFSRPGRYRVTVTATDRAGQASSKSGVVKVAR